MRTNDTSRVPTRRNLMDVAEVAAYLNRTVPAIRSMVYRQELPHIRLSERSVRFDRADIDRWLEARKVAAS